MKRFLTRYRGALRFTLALLPLAAAAGYLMLRYLMALYDEDTMAAMVAQLGSTTALLAIGTVQTVIYVAVASFFGYILAEKLGLMRPLRLEKRPLLRTLAVSIPLGVLFSLDYWTFGAWLPGTAVRDSAAAGLTVWGWSSAALYGGVMEELLMRLFLMSLLAFLGWKLFFRREKQSPTGVIIAANVLAALLFAAGHLPVTVGVFGALTPLILVRCFLLNGGFGLAAVPEIRHPVRHAQPRAAAHRQQADLDGIYIRKALTAGQRFFPPRELPRDAISGMMEKNAKGGTSDG